MFQSRSRLKSNFFLLEPVLEPEPVLKRTLEADYKTSLAACWYVNTACGFFTARRFFWLVPVVAGACRLKTRLQNSVLKQIWKKTFHLVFLLPLHRDQDSIWTRNQKVKWIQIQYGTGAMLVRSKALHTSSAQILNHGNRTSRLNNIRGAPKKNLSTVFLTLDFDRLHCLSWCSPTLSQFCSRWPCCEQSPTHPALDYDGTSTLFWVLVSPHLRAALSWHAMTWSTAARLKIPLVIIDIPVFQHLYCMGTRGPDFRLRPSKAPGMKPQPLYSLLIWI